LFPLSSLYICKVVLHQVTCFALKPI
jgi:hypothetical protein